jgi:hypothetical protein
MVLAAQSGLLTARAIAAPLDIPDGLPAPSALVATRVIQAKPDTATKTRISEAYGKLPLSFEVNRGQTDDNVKYLARGPGYVLFLTPTEAVLALRAQQPAVSGRQSARRNELEDNGKASRAVVRIKLVGVNAEAKIEGLDELPGKSNYFVGNDPKKWRTNIPTYAKVRYQDVYPGVDLVYYGNQRQLEYDLVVAPGADPQVVTLAFEGAQRLEIDADGNLVLHVAGGEVIQRAPVIYQEIEGARQAVTGRYTFRDKNRIGVHVAAYDPSKPLVIDPVLVYSTYLGGGAADVGNGIAVDFAGNAYVTGSTISIAPTAFPITAGAFQINLASAGFTDAFVTKLNAGGNMLVYSTYLGGGNDDVGNGIAVDGAGNAYVTGSTASAAPTAFPTTAGAFQTALANAAGQLDAFVTVLNTTGTALVYSTYLGGGNADVGHGITVDGAGNAYVTGSTLSAAPTAFPTTAGGFQIALASAGFTDAFVTKLNPAGAGAADLVYSTYLGGGNADVGNGIALDAARNAYVTGSTASAAPTAFPTTAGAFQTALANAAGQLDAFVTKLNTTGTALVYSTYLGGGNADVGRGIVVDAANSVYVAGSTASAAPTAFPTTAGAFQTALANAAAVTDAFVTKLNTTGTALVYSTYLGGGAGDVGNAIAIDGVGNAYVTGSTASANFPTAGSPFQAVLSVAPDAFVTKLNSTGSALVYSTYLGGGGADIGRGIAVDPLDNAYVTGETTSSVTTPPPFPTAGAFDDTFNGIIDAFIAKLMESPAAGGGGGGGGGSGSCFIATAAFDSPLAPQVQLLRTFRDRYLMTNAPGRLFVTTYYQMSPPVARSIADSEILRAITRAGLIPVIGWVSLFMWSPILGLAIPVVCITLGTRMTFRVMTRHRVQS